MVTCRVSVPTTHKEVCCGLYPLAYATPSFQDGCMCIGGRCFGLLCVKLCVCLCVRLQWSSAVCVWEVLPVGCVLLKWRRERVKIIHYYKLSYVCVL